VYELTITTAEAAKTTDHDDFPDAHQALMSHVIAEDLYLYTAAQGTRECPRFTLLHMPDNDRGTRIVGTATIAATPGRPVVSNYHSAQAALRWTADHTATWRHGCDTDPGVRYPMAVLTAARAEARYCFRAGSTYHEAAALSDAGSAEVPRPSQHLLEQLRHSAVTTGHAQTPVTAAELAAAVETELPENITAEQAAALIWFYALILWGVTAS
jgi:hypothetical protein